MTRDLKRKRRIARFSSWNSPHSGEESVVNLSAYHHPILLDRRISQLEWSSSVDDRRITPLLYNRPPTCLFLIFLRVHPCPSGQLLMSNNGRFRSEKLVDHESL
ncbi:hypothetical protein CDAR_423711 [Caerostris darwini]|uniref:Uncharacterized protein n=1 Tax=Caerostris darwini TaxID=1538125 RepID=A0AAV4VAG6_9ARAC|nr:hypothetical protein CDAR_423711 [Caerostris darwini]